MNNSTKDAGIRCCTLFSSFILAVLIGAAGCTKQAQPPAQPAPAATGTPAAAQPAGSFTTLTPGVLSIGMEIGYPPMEYLAEDGKTPIGFDVEMAKALAQKLGLTPQFIDTAWDGIFAGVETDKYDCIISAVTVTDARIQAHNLTKPYIVNEMSLVVLKDSPLATHITSPADLNGRSVTYQAETTADFYMAKLKADTGLEFTPYEYDKVINCFDELKLKRADVVIVDSLVAVDYVAQPDSPFKIVWQGSGAEKETFAICLKKGNNGLTAALDKALDELFADGTMQKISQDIFKMDLVSAARQP